MNSPPPYPRIPYLWAPDSAADNLVSATERAGWLSRPVTVEEKLDGANVSLWLDGATIRVASRGGLGAMDRGGQLGRLRAWSSERDAILRPLLSSGHVLYGEWLWLTHGVKYDALPDWLVLLDVLRPDGTWAELAERDRLAEHAALPLPPRVFAGVLRTQDEVLGLLGMSAYGSEPAEGLIIRDTAGRRCKVVRPGFRRVEDPAIGSFRPHNALA